MGKINQKKLFLNIRRNTVLKNSLLILANVFVMLVTIGTILAFTIYRSISLNQILDSYKTQQTSIIYDRSGDHILYEIHGEENRKVISHSEIPDTARMATIASEDDNFYNHNGIDFKSIFRAIKTDLKNASPDQGGSTITQQLARNMLLTREKTLRRKIAEIILAIKIEKAYSKDQILDMYLNEVPYGSNAYGLEAAANVFFGKDASDLTLDEAALLAALPKAPTYYSPYGNHTDELISRQQKILSRITELRLISENSAAEAKKIIALAKITPFKEPIDCPHFVFYVKEKLEEQYGRDIVEKGGLKIFTTLDYEMQKLAEKVVSDSDRNNRGYGAENAALVSLDPKSGQILAMVGSKNYFDASIDGQVNVATRPRQPGSSFKPFAYSKAFEKGYQPENLIIDAPTDFGPDGSGQNYIPRNYDGKFHGIVTMRQALAMSLNIPAVKTLYLAGVDDTIELAHRLGITTLNKKNYYGLSLVLGGGEVTLLDETAGYSVFANDGKRNPVTAILKITDSQDRLIYNSTPQNLAVLDQQIARKINSILSDNDARVPIFGSTNKLHIEGRAVAAKTGTAQEFRDAWAVGYTPALAAGVWAGNNDNRPMRSGADGSYVAAPIWHDFMVQALKKYPDEQFIAYDKQEKVNLLAFLANDLKTSYYNKETGKKLSEKKLKKTDPDKIEIRYKLPNSNDSQSQLPLSVEFINSSDPMIKRWRNPIKEAS